MNALVPQSARTPRLELRQFRESDLPDLLPLFGDPEVTRFTMKRTLDEAESWRMICTVLGHWQVRGYGPYAVEERATGRVLGSIGFWYPYDWPGPEIKWSLARAHQGRGFASEAVRCVQALAHAHVPQTSLISLVLPENTASRNLARAVGARQGEDLVVRGDRCLVFHHPPVPGA